jgi:hypothetical protein
MEPKEARGPNSARKVSMMVCNLSISPSGTEDFGVKGLGDAETKRDKCEIDSRKANKTEVSLSLAVS